MKKITATILLALFSVSIFAQGNSYQQKNTGSDFIMTFGNKIGTIISISPKKMNGYGIFIDWKFFDGYTSDINSLETIKTPIRRNEYYTWQTNYGSYTKVTEERGTFLFQKDYITHSNLSLGIVIPTNKTSLRFYLGAGAEIKKIRHHSFLNHYHSIEENTYYSTINRYYHNYDIGQDAGKSDIEYPDISTYTFTPNITYGVIYGNAFTLSAGFDTNVYNKKTRTEFFMGIGLRF